MKAQVSLTKKVDDATARISYLQEIIDKIKTGIAVYDVTQGCNDFIFSDFTKAAEKIDHQKKSTLVGRSIYDVRPGIERFGLIETMKKVCRTKRPASHPVTFYDDESLKGWYENYIFPLSSGQIVAAFRDATKQMQVIEALKQSEMQFKVIAESAVDCIFLKDAQRRYTFVNGAIKDLLGLKNTDILGKRPHEIYDPVTAAQVQEVDDATFKGTIINERREITVNGIAKTLHTIQVPLRNEAGDIPTICGIVRDVTEQHQYEEQLKSSLQEKEILLKEIHHRVKNNLQIIASIISLQLHSVKSEEAREILLDTRNRIFSIALIHTGLYESDNFSAIDFPNYLQELTQSLLNSYNCDNLRIVASCGQISIPIGPAIPVAIMINEIVTNSIKHAFPDMRKGKITISFSKKRKNYHLRVTDNGVGLPDNFDFSTTHSLGISIIRNLLQQIDGTVVLTSERGTVYDIRIPTE